MKLCLKSVIFSWLFTVGLINEIKFTSGRKHVKHRSGVIHKNFVSVRYNAHNERELRIAFKGILFQETTAFQNSSYEMKMKQLTDGFKIVQSVIQGDRMKDCDYSEDSKTILHFVHAFASDPEVFRREEKGNVFSFYTQNKSDSNTYALQFFKHRKFLGPFRNYIKIRHDVKSCHRVARHVKGDHGYFGNSNYLLGTSDNGQKKSPVSDTYPGDRSSSSLTSSHVRLHRNKRSFFSSFLMYPGTKWCGRGQTAKHYGEIGEDYELDVCCRDHDVCPLIIEPFSSKFNYFNYRFHALIHCKCDEEFRSCLKQSLSPNAHFLGKIYFNIMGSKCFVLRDSKICAQYSWWGTCLKYKNTTSAFIKTQKYFSLDNK